MDSHKRLLSILHIAYGMLHVVIFIIVNLLLRTIFPFIESELESSNGEGLAIIQMVFSFVRSIFFILIIMMPLPSIVGGAALLNGKKWGLTLLLISGCLALFSVPIGSALGIYTLWVYLENQKAEKLNDKN